MFRRELNLMDILLQHTAGKLKKIVLECFREIKFLIEMTPYDLTKGRIIWRS